MTLTNGTRSIKWHETCKCISRLNKIICNNKKRQNEDKYRCECKELTDKRVCDKRFIWNPSNCESEYDKSCNISQYLDYSDYKCKKKLIDPLIKECTENDNEAKRVNITVKNENSSCKVYIVLMTVVFTIFTGVTIYFVCYNSLKIKFFALNLILTKKH